MAKWATGTPPNKSGRYLVTIESHFGRQVRQADRVNLHKDYWKWSVLPECSSPNVIAWQKCPEPYKL